MRALSRASEEFLKAPGGFSDVGLLHPRGLLFIGRDDQRSSISALYGELSESGDTHRLDNPGARERCPLLRDDYTAEAIWYPAAWDIDVDALLGGYSRRMKQLGGELLTGRRVAGLESTGSGWTVQTDGGDIRCDIVVNAAGAWADGVAVLAGVAPAGIVPKRRTAATIKMPDGTDIGGCSMVVDVDEQFYAKPWSGQLLISPADETPVPAGDVHPEELDIAIAADRAGKAFDIEIKRIESSWAGLRSFAPDGCPVVGFDAQHDGFFWCAGQGGYGIQTAPAIARLAAARILGGSVPGDILAHGLDPADIDARRFAEPG